MVKTTILDYELMCKKEKNKEFLNSDEMYLKNRCSLINYHDVLGITHERKVEAPKQKKEFNINALRSKTKELNNQKKDKQHTKEIKR